MTHCHEEADGSHALWHIKVTIALNCNIWRQVCTYIRTSARRDVHCTMFSCMYVQCNCTLYIHDIHTRKHGNALCMSSYHRNICISNQPSPAHSDKKISYEICTKTYFSDGRDGYIGHFFAFWVNSSSYITDIKVIYLIIPKVLLCYFLVNLLA